jgi:hypothetical protein
MAGKNKRRRPLNKPPIPTMNIQVFVADDENPGGTVPVSKTHQVIDCALRCRSALSRIAAQETDRLSRSISSSRMMKFIGRSVQIEATSGRGFRQSRGRTLAGVPRDQDHAQSARQRPRIEHGDDPPFAGITGMR